MAIPGDFFNQPVKSNRKVKKWQFFSFSCRFLRLHPPLSALTPAPIRTYCHLLPLPLMLMHKYRQENDKSRNGTGQANDYLTGDIVCQKAGPVFNHFHSLHRTTIDIFSHTTCSGEYVDRIYDIDIHSCCTGSPLRYKDCNPKR